MKTALALALAATLGFAQTAAKDAKKAAPVKAEPTKAEAPKAPIKASEPAAGLVGNKDSKTYHKADCKTAAKMKPANKVSLASKAEAEKQGYKACKICKP